MCKYTSIIKARNYIINESKRIHIVYVMLYCSNVLCILITPRIIIVCCTTSKRLITMYV